MADKELPALDWPSLEAIGIVPDIPTTDRVLEHVPTLEDESSWWKPADWKGSEGEMYFSHGGVTQRLDPSFDVLAYIQNYMLERYEVEVRNTIIWGSAWRDNEDHIVRGTD